MNAEQVSELITDLSRRAWALAALTIASERGMLRALAEGPRDVASLASVTSLAPKTVAAAADVLVAIGLAHRDGDRIRLDPGLVERCSRPEGHELLNAELRSTVSSILGATRAARDPASVVEGWRADDVDLVRAQGRLSRAVTRQMGMFFTGQPDLHARLSTPGARFLDVGAGAAGLCIAFAELYPTLHVVGIEPSATAVEAARAAIRAEGLDDRIEIRTGLGQSLDERAQYAAAYVAQMFIPDDAIDAVLSATYEALEPGGLVFTGAMSHEGVDLVCSVSRFRNAIWGGSVRTSANVVELLARAGFPDAMAMPVPPGALSPVMAHRPKS